MIRIYQERENKQHIEQATSYAFRMVFNACLDQLRKKAKNNFEQLNGKDVLVIDNDKHIGIAGITSEEATKRFFVGCQTEDWKTVRQLIPGFANFIQLELIVKAEYGGLTIISLGKSFKSGQYPGEFVPYSIRLKSGNIKKMNLALRRDNPEKKWVVDGGF